MDKIVPTREKFVVEVVDWVLTIGTGGGAGPGRRHWGLLVRRRCWRSRLVSSVNAPGGM
jgi:hypothetical protein